MKSAEETIEYWLEPELYEALWRSVDGRIARKIAELGKALEEVAALRNVVNVKQIDAAAPPVFDVYAIDSSYTSPPLELVGGVLAVLAYGYFGVSGGVQDKYLTGRLYFEDSDERNISRVAAVEERRLAARLLWKKHRGEKKLDLLILDGEIAVHPLPFNLAVEHKEINEVVGKMLRNASVTRTSVVAVTKRVRSRHLSVLAGKCLKMNDKAAASAILRPGEYFVLGRLRDILPKWAPIYYAECRGGEEKDAILRCHEGGGAARLSPRGALLCKRLGEFYGNFEKVLSHPTLKLLGDVVIAYYLPPGLKTAVRVEVLDFGELGIEKIISYLMLTTSTATGYPLILDTVDRYVKAPQELADAMYMAITSKTPDRLTHLMWSTNMQKQLRRY